MVEHILQTKAFISKIIGTQISFIQYDTVDEGGENWFVSDKQLKTV
jgi:hypothetical protein